MARSIVGVVAGVIVAGLVVLLIEIAGMAVFPPPTGMDPTNPDSIRAHMSALPVGAFLMVLAGWTAGGFAGAWAAGLISSRPVRWPGLVAGAIFAAACVMNLVTLPHPVWFAIAALLLVPAAIWIGTTSGTGGLRAAHGTGR